MPTYDAIIEAAALVLKQHGIEGLTTNRVAEVAGVSIGSLYQYFPNKHAIACALIDRYHQRIVEIVGPILVDAASIDEICTRSAVGLLALERDRQVFAHLRLLRTAAGADELIAQHLDAMVDRAAAALIQLGVATATDAQDIAYVVVQSAEGLANALARSKHVDIARIATIYFDFVRRYFQVELAMRSPAITARARACL